MSPRTRAKGPGELKVELVSIDSLTPDPDNARRHNRRNIEAIKASLEEFGQRRPLVTTKTGVVVAGNGTLQAAEELEWTEINIHRAPWRDKEKCRAYAITDNRTAELASWDERLVAEQTARMGKAGFELERLGWTEAELRKMGDHQDLRDEDGPPPPKRPRAHAPRRPLAPRGAPGALRRRHARARGASAHG